MPRNHLTEKQIESLTTNPHVKFVSTKGIQYTDEFKRIFIAEKKKENYQDKFLRRTDLMLTLLVLSEYKEQPPDGVLLIINQEY